jgi:quercetin dioxygenase-like cupin family protein
LSTPEISIGQTGNIFSRQMTFLKAGDTELGHSHPHDHLTLLASGGLRVTIDDQETVFQAPHMIYIRRNQVHILTATEDNTVAFCIHALRDADTGDILDPDMVPKKTQPLINNP